MKRILSLLLVLSVFLTLSCSSGSETSNNDAVDTTNSTSDTTNQLEAIYRDRADLLPELDLNNQTVNFLSMDGDVYDSEIMVEELKSEALNDSIYYRNIYVEDLLNCKITNERYGYKTSREKLQICISSGDNNYQFFVHEAAPTLDLAIEDNFYNLIDLEKGYLELTAPWWSQDYIKEIGTDSKLYALTGAISLSMLRSIHATFFNKAMAEDNGIEDLYEVVNDGRWTIDYQNEIVSKLYRDLNGDSIADEEDQFGYASPVYWALDSYIAAFDIDILSRDSNDDFFYNLNTDKAETAAQKLFSLHWENKGSYIDNDHNSTLERMFASDRILFLSDKLLAIESETMRNMKSDYGIIPMPKYDENQSDYYSMPYEVFHLYAIPVTVPNPDEISAVLEAMCAETWRKVIPTYSDLALKGKYLNDPTSRAMFDKIIENMQIEAGVLYAYQSNEIAAKLFRYAVGHQEVDKFASTMAQCERLMPKLLDALNKSLD